MLVNKIIYNVYHHNLEESKFFWSMKVPGLRWWACSMKPDLKTTFEFCTERTRTFLRRNSDSARKEILPKAGRNATNNQTFMILILKVMKSWTKDLYFTTKFSRLLQQEFVALIPLNLVSEKNSPVVSKNTQSLSDR